MTRTCTHFMKAWWEAQTLSQPILDVYMKHSQGDQRVMENLCTRLAYLFCIGSSLWGLLRHPGGWFGISEWRVGREYEERAGEKCRRCWGDASDCESFLHNRHSLLPLCFAFSSYSNRLHRPAALSSWWLQVMLSVQSHSCNLVLGFCFLITQSHFFMLCLGLTLHDQDISH